MPAGGHLVAFALTASALIVIPGPSVLFVISRSLVLGAPAGLATVVGNAGGGFVQVLAVAFGLGTLVQRSVALLTILKLVGAAYLMYLGVQAIRHRRSLADALGAPVEAKTRRRILRDAFVVVSPTPRPSSSSRLSCPSLSTGRLGTSLCSSCSSGRCST